MIKGSSLPLTLDEKRQRGNGDLPFFYIFTRRLSENALLPKLFVMPEKIILGISTICLW